MNSRLLSVVMPVYNEINIKANCLRLRRALNDADIPHELIIVDDGSTNGAWNEISDLAESLDNVTAISFARNFGKESALCAGIDAANGSCLICVDSDMQFPPEEIPAMYKLWEEGYEVVEGVKKSRQSEGALYRLCSNTFYTVLKRLSGIDLKNGCDFRLLDRAAIDAWKSMPERQTFFRGMSTWIGFKRVRYPFEVADRADGQSKWSVKALSKLAVDAVTSYTAVPLYLSALAGLIFLLFALIMGIQTLYMFISGHAGNGFTTVILLLLIIGSAVMLGQSIIGIYIKKIYEETKGRPRYIIRKKITKNNLPKGAANK